jgi:hypothetical protein
MAVYLFFVLCKQIGDYGGIGGSLRDTHPNSQLISLCHEFSTVHQIR